MMLEILLPVYNEELRLENGVTKTIEYMDALRTDYHITIVDNASIDETKAIAEKLEKRFEQVEYLRLEKKGVGVAFKEGVKNSNADIIGYMDIDLSTDIRHLKEVVEAFQNSPDLDMINGSRLNKKSITTGRKWYRNITSNGLSLLLKIVFGMKATDSICGFKFFKRESVNLLIENARKDVDGWFYIIELLLRAEKIGMNIKELPVRWEDELHSTVNVKKLIMNYIREIFLLKIKFIQEEK